MKRIFEFGLNIFKRYQFLRYVFVGGVSFVVDYIVLILVRDFIFPTQSFGLGAATVAGAVIGHLCNYYLGLIVAFNSDKEREQGSNFKAFMLIAFVGLIGMILKVILMYVSTAIFGDEYYKLLNIPVAGICLIWNYIGRKIFVFKKEQLEDNEK